MNKVLEICIDGVESARNALKGGADQLEVCSALCLGGLSPSVGLLRRLRRLFPDARLMCMIRPRAGNFVYSEEEFEVMKEEIEALREAGATGFVFGILTRENTLDVSRLSQLIQLAGDRPCTLHRAFDLTPDWHQALTNAVRLKFKTILTSGQRPTALEGAETLKKIVETAEMEKIEILVGSGVNGRTLPQLILQTAASMFHGSASVALQNTLPPPPFPMGSAETETIKETSEDEVRLMKKCLVG